MLHWKTGSRKGQIYKDDVLPVIQTQAIRLPVVTIKKAKILHKYLLCLVNNTTGTCCISQITVTREGDWFVQVHTHFLTDMYIVFVCC